MGSSNKQLLSPHVAFQDCLFLSLVVLLSLIVYVKGLGFYSDDWSDLSLFKNSKDQSIPGLFRSMSSAAPFTRIRPIKILYSAALYSLFGVNPLGYHVVNAAVFNLAILLFYLTLRELCHFRIFILTLPLVYAIVPHYSTDRFWISASAANLSMCLYFLSCYSALRALRGNSTSRHLLNFVSILAMLGSTLTYEVTLPLFIIIPFLVWYRFKRVQGTVSNKQERFATPAVFLAAILGMLLMIAGFKVLAQERFKYHFRFAKHMDAVIRHAITQTLKFNFGDYGLGMPRILWQIVRRYPNTTTFAVGGLMGVIIFAYLLHVVIRPRTKFPESRSWWLLALSGLAVFGLAYSIFLVNTEVDITTTGVANRVAIAAAMGTAMWLLGMLGWASTLIKSDMIAKTAYCILVTGLCVSGFLINNVLSSFWISASTVQQEILTDIRERFPTLPIGTTFILDGICSYVGPGIVFESDWDLAGALGIFYQDPTIQANIVTPRMRTDKEYLFTSVYGEESRYPYGKNLIIYNFKRKISLRLTSLDIARSYFQNFNQDYNSNCPRGTAGEGVPVF